MFLKNLGETFVVSRKQKQNVSAINECCVCAQTRNRSGKQCFRPWVDNVRLSFAVGGPLAWEHSRLQLFSPLGGLGGKVLSGSREPVEVAVSTGSVIGH